MGGKKCKLQERVGSGEKVLSFHKSELLSPVQRGLPSNRSFPSRETSQVEAVVKETLLRNFSFTSIYHKFGEW